MRRHTCLGELPELLLLHGCLQLLAERRVAHDEVRVQPLEHGDLQSEASVRHTAHCTAHSAVCAGCPYLIVEDVQERRTGGRHGDALGELWCAG